MTGSNFVRSATTDVPADKSQAEIIGVLARYGASGFGFRRRGDVIEVTFHLPRPTGDDQSVRIPVNVATVRAKLNEFWESPKRPHTRKPDLNAQAERVAWRALLTWIEASLLAVALGAQSMEEAFFAHVLVTDESGQEGRIIEYVGTLAAGANGVLPSPRRLLLGSGDKP